MEMQGRKYSVQVPYRYGFNGKENDNEVKGEGNLQDYGMRMYEPRLGRFISLDPLVNKYAELTPYQFASNKPINSIDQDGGESKEVYQWTNTAGKTTTWTVEVHNPYGLGDGTLYHIYNSKEVSAQQTNKQTVEVRVLTSATHVYKPTPRTFLQSIGDWLQSTKMPQAIIFGSEHSSDYTIGSTFDPSRPVMILDYGAASEIFSLLPEINEAGKPAEMPTNENVADKLNSVVNEAVEKEAEENPDDANAADYLKQEKQQETTINSKKSTKDKDYNKYCTDCNRTFIKQGNDTIGLQPGNPKIKTIKGKVDTINVNSSDHPKTPVKTN
jgi:RHS repeat-associated protein